MSRVRNFCFTLNNYTPEEEKKIQTLENIQYLIYGKELAPTTGTPHLQGYIQLQKQIVFSKCTNMIPRWNICISKGTAEQNIAYCSKSGDVFCLGEPKNPGKRNDLQTMLQEVKQGSNMRQVIEMCSNYQSIKTAEKLMQYYEQPRHGQTFVYWFYGKAGVGKTEISRKILGQDCYVKDSGKFWNSYDGQINVLIDDFRKDNFPFDYLLRVLDRYPMIIEVKGSSRQLKAQLIVITSDRAPWDIWHGNDYDQIFRRIHMCIQVGVQYYPQPLSRNL